MQNKTQDIAWKMITGLSYLSDQNSVPRDVDLDSVSWPHDWQHELHAVALEIADETGVSFEEAMTAGIQALITERYH